MNAAEAMVEPSIVGGRYWISCPLAVGGMAEVFLAKHRGDDGFVKDVVIKRLKPELARDPRIVSMFKDEARLSAQLSHANTVHVYDGGIDDGVPYIVMEYIRGEELNVLCRRGIGCGEFLPLEHALELVRQAALGMGYYHNLRDADGKLMDVVHCDISPNNLLVGQDGYLQVIDFGISQFQGQHYRDAQLVPGKLSYMSPEQARRDTLDHRTDIFSLGVVLYEITLGQRLFRGSASEVLPRLLSCDVKAPTFVRNDYPGALESIVMRCLEPAPSDRYQEAYDLADALGVFLREEKMRTSPVAVARYLDRLSVAAGGQCREELISELEIKSDDEVLNFDRGVFSGFQALAEAIPNAATAWDELDEDAGAVAQALGIDVKLVRTASSAQEIRKPVRATATSKKAASAKAETEPETEPAASAEPEVADTEDAQGSGGTFLMLVIGIILGVCGAFAAGALS